MTVCTKQNNYGSNLDYLDDEEFEILLAHAAVCSACDELLQKYEGDLIPMLKIALAAEAAQHDKAGSWRQRIWASDYYGLVALFDSLRRMSKNAFRLIGRQPIHAAGLLITMLIAISALGNWIYTNDLSSEAADVPQPVTVAVDEKITVADIPEHRSAALMAEKSGRYRDVEKPAAIKGDNRKPEKSNTSASVTSFSVEGIDGSSEVVNVNAEETESGLIVRRSNPNFAYVGVRLIAVGSDFANITCTLYDRSPNPSPPSEIRNPLRGYCAWELPVRSRFELVVTNTETGKIQKRQIITQENSIQFLDVDLSETISPAENPIAPPVFLP